jgi:hypothetical protein
MRENAGARKARASAREERGARIGEGEGEREGRREGGRERERDMALHRGGKLRFLRVFASASAARAAGRARGSLHGFNSALCARDTYRAARVLCSVDELCIRRARPFIALPYHR